MRLRLVLTLLLLVVGVTVAGVRGEAPRPAAHVTAAAEPRDYPPHASRYLVRAPLPTPRSSSSTRALPHPTATSPRPRATRHAASHPTASAWTVWAHRPFSIAVANCESGPGPSTPRYDRYVGDPHLSDPNGHYGKWQFAPSTWWSVGGTGNAAAASEAEQDYRAWLLWRRDGYSPWECARLIG